MYDVLFIGGDDGLDSKFVCLELGMQVVQSPPAALQGFAEQVIKQLHS